MLVDVAVGEIGHLTDIHQNLLNIGRLLLGVKPGITSWGQVRFGYAENVDEMIERLRWDILYIENMSILMDIKILIYTVLIILKREGK